ncbi:MAG: F0F1 ATP synthase subunit epsilon [Streptosporangiaceae bacterium]
MPLEVELVSPEREVWSGEGHMVLARTLVGELGIMPGHQSLLGVLEDGDVVRVRRDDGPDITAAVHGGFFSVHADRVSILAESAELAEEIDVDRARRALDDAERRGDEEEGAAADAARARARLRAAEET